MVRIINFIGRRGTYDLPTFLLTENEVLTLKFMGLDVTLGRYVVTVRHGTQSKTYYLSTAMTVDIMPEWLAVNGEKPLEVFIELRDNTGTKTLIQSAKSTYDQMGFYIEPLKLEKVGKNFSMVAWLQRLESLINESNAKIDKQFAVAEKELTDIKTKLAEYENNGVPLAFED